MIEAMPNLSAHTGLHETLALLMSQLHPAASRTQEDLGFLKDVFSEKSLGYLMKVHEKLRRYERQSPAPVLHSASCLAEDLVEALQIGPMAADERELLLLLSAPHLKAVLTAHDTVAQKRFDPVLPPLPKELGEEEETVKIVCLVKNKEPLGATIRRDEETGAVIVARIMRGGAADRSGLVHVGDELREVNGTQIVHQRPDEISQLLSQSRGSITLKLIPALPEDNRLKERQVYLKALFDYTPFEDKATPCQEAGLPFRRGDILMVVSGGDSTWWQARRVGDASLRAALIPSAQFQERRLRYRMKMGTYQAPVSPITTTSGLRRGLRSSQRGRQGSPGEPHTQDFLIYQEVTRYRSRPSERPRTVVLMGSLGVGTSELKQQVISERPCHYGAAVPHTTRARKDHERDGVDYHFVSKQAFEADVQNDRFIEHGEYKDNLYGTSLQSVRKVLDQNRTCLLDVQPEALRTLGTAEFKPYVVFVRPDVPESCRPHGRSSLSDGIAEDLQEMSQSARQMEESFGHLVDWVLVKEDLASACAELHKVLERIETEAHWVPVSWVRT